MWLEPIHRADILRALKENYRSISPTKYEREILPRCAHYANVRYHIDQHVVEAMAGRRTPFTLLDAVAKVEERTGVRFHERTLEALCQKYAKRTGRPLLVRVDEFPSAYRLAYAP